MNKKKKIILFSSIFGSISTIGIATSIIFIVRNSKNILNQDSSSLNGDSTLENRPTSKPNITPTTPTINETIIFNNLDNLYYSINDEVFEKKCTLSEFKEDLKLKEYKEY
ncbi:MAG: hypothetical protein K2I49_00660, partial [Ureaplasma sp.]|nr:hypothetical protein [Ureaplasma sp.]